MNYATPDYTNMVNSLAKPGEEIMYDLNSRRAHIWHMATGVAGEAGELMENFILKGLDRENLVEEIGDTLFYITGIRNEYDLTATVNTSLNNLLPFNVYGHVMIHACAVLDVVKKHVVYAKPLDIEALSNAVCQLEARLADLATAIGTDLATIAQANMDKLLRSPNARYKEGTYSNEAAQSRRDKIE